MVYGRTKESRKAMLGLKIILEKQIERHQITYVDLKRSIA